MFDILKVTLRQKASESRDLLLIETAFKSLEKYFLLIVQQPWKMEFREIKVCVGLYSSIKLVIHGSVSGQGLRAGWLWGGICCYHGAAVALSHLFSLNLNVSVVCHLLNGSIIICCFGSFVICFLGLLSSAVWELYHLLFGTFVICCLGGFIICCWVFCHLLFGTFVICCLGRFVICCILYNWIIWHTVLLIQICLLRLCLLVCWSFSWYQSL